MLLEIVGKFYDNHSLSIVNRNLAIGLSNAGIMTKIVAMDSYDPAYKLDKAVIRKLKQLEAVNFEAAPDIQLRHTYPPLWRWPEHDSTKIVYIQPWEFTKSLMEWQYKFENFADALIVPSSFTKSVFLNGGLNPKKVYTVPNGFNPGIFNEQPTDIDVSQYGVNPKKFNFMYVGNAQWRKGLNTLLSAWIASFSRADNARLIIKDNTKVYGASNILQEIIKLQYKHNCGEIIYIDDDLSDNEMAALYKSSKVLVHPYRAEGFAMHVQEAMACGCIPLVSADGPTDDFVPDHAAIKIPVQKQYININDPEIFACKPGDAMTMMSTHTLFNDPSKNHLVHQMINLYRAEDIIRRDIGDIKTNINTWDDVVQQYIRVLSAVHDKNSVTRERSN